jgi:hypothetical protein
MLENSTTNSSSLGSSISHLNNSVLSNNHPISSSALTSGIAVNSQTNERLDASSDSAVSSMGSERVASDGEWGEAGGESVQDYNQSYANKYNVLITKL